MVGLPKMQAKWSRICFVSTQQYHFTLSWAGELIIQKSDGERGRRPEWQRGEGDGDQQEAKKRRLQGGGQVKKKYEVMTEANVVMLEGNITDPQTTPAEAFPSIQASLLSILLPSHCSSLMGWLIPLTRCHHHHCCQHQSPGSSLQEMHMRIWGKHTWTCK